MRVRFFKSSVLGVTASMLICGVSLADVKVNSAQVGEGEKFPLVSLKGKVVDQANLPIMDAEVNLWEIKRSIHSRRPGGDNWGYDQKGYYPSLIVSLRTDKEGNFVYQGSISPGFYDVRVSKGGYKPEIRTIFLDLNKPQNIDFSLTPFEFPYNWWKVKDGRIMDSEGNQLGALRGWECWHYMDDLVKKELPLSKKKELIRGTVKDLAQSGYSLISIICLDLDLVEAVVEEAKQEGIYLILTTYSPQCLMDEEVRKEHWKIWQVLAKKYRDEPAIIAYELVAEAGTLTPPFYMWEYCKSLIEEIRKYDRRHIIILANGWGMTEAGMWIKYGLPPDPMDNLMYDHHQFSHWWYQGAPICADPGQGGETILKFKQICAIGNSKIPAWWGSWSCLKDSSYFAHLKDLYERWDTYQYPQTILTPMCKECWFFRGYESPYILVSNPIEWADFDIISSLYTIKLEGGKGEADLKVKIPIRHYGRGDFRLFCSSKAKQKFFPATRILEIKCKKGSYIWISPKDFKFKRLKIKGIKANLQGEKVNLRWRTNRAATSRVIYSSKEEYGRYGMLFYKKADEAKKTRHQLELEIPLPASGICFRIKSRDEEGNLGVSPIKTFNFSELKEMPSEGWEVIEKGIIPATGITMDGQGNIYLASYYDHCVRKINPQGEVLWTLGKYNLQGKGPNSFKGPTDVEIDKEGNIWVTDTVNNRLVKFDSRGNFLMQIEAALGTPLKWPCFMELDKEGNICVSDGLNHRVVVLDPEGNGLKQIKVPYLGSNGPRGITFDKEGNMYVVIHDVISKYNPKGLPENGWGYKGMVGLDMPRDIVVDKEGYLYSVNNDAKSLTVCNSSGQIVLNISSFPGTKELLPSPFGLYLKEDTLYITFYREALVLKCDINGLKRKIKPEQISGNPAGSNLLKNPSFEVLERGNPVFWENYLDGFKLDNEIAHEGKYSIDLGGNNPRGIEQTLELVGNRRYRLSVWAKGKEATGKILLKLVFHAHHMVYLPFRIVEIPEGSYDWKRIEVNFNPPFVATHELKVILQSQDNHGSMWIDDLELIQIK